MKERKSAQAVSWNYPKYLFEALKRKEISFLSLESIYIIKLEDGKVKVSFSLKITLVHKEKEQDYSCSLKSQYLCGFWLIRNISSEDP